MSAPLAPLRVLLVEDSATDAKLVILALASSGRQVEHERVEDAASMQAALERRPWDVVLSDWSLPTFSAMGALDTLKRTGLDLPFIIVSGTVGEEAAVDAMRAGAHDYVLKDRLGRLVPAVERELRDCRERAARRASEALNAAIVRSSLDAIVATDYAGSVVEFSPAAEKCFGYSRAEALGQSLAALIVPERFQEEHLARRTAYVAGADRAAFDEATALIARRKDGSELAIERRIAPLDARSPEIIMAFIRDLSERTQAQAREAQAEEALRRSEAQLRQAQKMEAVGRLAGGVAHDFNNVLCVILSYGEMILSDLPATDPMRTDVTEILKAASRAAGLTRQLLLFSRQQVIEPRVVDLHDVLTSMDRMLQRILGEDVDLVLVAPKAAGRVRVDPSHVEQVILNLVVNARDAMPIGGKLTIETSNVVLDQAYADAHVPAKAGPYVMMAVSDTGIGMIRETVTHIFEPFFTTKGVGKGTGLGLSTVFGIVQQSGGNIWVYSEPGKGTTFKVYLPRVDAAADAPTPTVAPATLRGKETILLVEDEEQVRTVVLGILRKQGYHVIPCQHAGEALLHCESHWGRIDLLLTDVVMPQMSGPELAKRLAAARPEMKVLCMSGYTDDSIVRHGVLESGVAFLQKPVTPAMLARKIREVLDAEPFGPEPRLPPSP